MSITLTTAFNPGDFDLGKTYSKIRVLEYTVDYVRKELRFKIGRGYLDIESKWIWARLCDGGEFLISEHIVVDIPAKPEEIDENGDPIPGTDTPADLKFTNLVANFTGAAQIEAWVIANMPEYDGTIDP